ncbi:MAG: endolytic transglycosylase MltG [Caldilineaceae bacterium]|nr:endolytic transglycosylase MltG [Caldilineaceae bacterium]MDE0339746.1 endolytic transglycosylase MltG [Caldilineaceae bacterium]
MNCQRICQETHDFSPHHAGSRRKTALIALLLFLTVPLAACTREERLYDHLEANRPMLFVRASNEDTVIPFEIKVGSPARTISENLASAGLIHDAELFEAYVRSIGRAQELKAGSFQLRASMTPAEIAEVLLAEQAPGVSVTIREGWRLEQVAQDLELNKIVSGEEYRNTAQKPDLAALSKIAPSNAATAPKVDPPSCCEVKIERWPFLDALPQDASLEGFLFPATYELPAEEPAAGELIARQLDAFAARIMPLYLKAEADGVDPPVLYDVLIMASIVEREAVVAEERPAIAGVLYNRLANNMLLEIDATVQYAMGYQPESDQWWKTPVFLEEYQGVHSPYNTYLHRGLPPGPIANPGEDAFRAVLYPERHEFLYYVASGDGSGGHVFAKTFSEHLENVQRYLNR